MNFRKAKEEDVLRINKIYKDGSDTLKSLNIDQWQGSQMPVASSSDNLFVLEDKGEIKSTALLLGKDKDYENVKDWQWTSYDNYIAIHRVATAREVKSKGYADNLFKEIELFAKKNNIFNLRVDTHEDNFPMQNFLKKNGYKFCGIVYLEKSGKRLAYDKMLV
ncbi:MAG: GNAT family N-acetyltransferase [Peptoniphilaceae bacterium]